MSKIVKKIAGIPDLLSVGGSTDNQIEEAQKSLNLTFSSEYIDYVKHYGCISFDAIEWTGLNINGRLNVVTATENERKLNQNFPKDVILLENLGIDGKVVVVNERNEVLLVQKEKIALLENSLYDYLELILNNN